MSPTVRLIWLAVWTLGALSLTAWVLWTTDDTPPTDETEEQ